tara:strand:- start:3204 stop:5681 length:2478 start_codon:yes stop_codon:yes gene_type:complete
MTPEQNAAVDALLADPERGMNAAPQANAAPVSGGNVVLANNGAAQVPVTPQSGGRVNLTPEQDAAVNAELANPVYTSEPGPAELLLNATPNPDPMQTAASLVERRELGRFPTGNRPDIQWANPSTYWDRITLAATGEDRQTKEVEALPALAEMGVQNLLGDTSRGPISGALTSAAMLTTFDPVEIVQMLHEQSGGQLNVSADDAGNIIFDVQGRKAMLNKPGMTAMDYMQLGATAAAFTPAGRAAKIGTGVIRNAARVAGASGATQAGIEVFQKEMGGNIDPVEVGIAAGGGFVGQGLFQGIANVLPALARQVKESGFTDEVVGQFRKYKPEWMAEADFLAEVQKWGDSLVMGPDATPQEIIANAGEQQFGIDLTRGQRNAGPTIKQQNQIKREDLARAGAFGNSAQGVMLDIRDKQNQQISEVVGSFYDNIAPGISPTAGPGLIRQQLGENYGIDRADMQQKYALAGPAELAKDPTIEIFENVMAVRDLPRTAEWRTETKQSLNFFQQEIDKLNELPDGPDSVINFEKLETFRQRLGDSQRASRDDADKTQIGLMIDAFDTTQEDIIFRELFTGDPNALTATKQGRAAYAAMANKYFKQSTSGLSGITTDSDPGGVLVEKILTSELTDAQIVNGIFGANGIQSMHGNSIVNKLRGALGEDSEAWTGLRAIAANRFFIFKQENGKDVFNARDSLKAFDTAMDKSPELMRNLFSEDELINMKGLIDHVKRTKPDIVGRSEVNPSMSAVVAMENIGRIIMRIVGVGGLVDSSGATVATAYAGNKVAGALGGLEQKIRQGGRPQDIKVPYRLPVNATNVAIQRSASDD